MKYLLKKIKTGAAVVTVCISTTFVCGGCSGDVRDAESVHVSGDAQILEESQEQMVGEIDADFGGVDEAGIRVTDVAGSESGAVECGHASPSEVSETSKAMLSIAEISDFPVAKPNLIEIDYVDYEEGMVSVYFRSRVKWTEPIVRVTDASDQAYPAKVEKISEEICTILVEGLEVSGEYEFLLGGLIERESEELTTLKGYFEKPEIAPGA